MGANTDIFALLFALASAAVVAMMLAGTPRLVLWTIGFYIPLSSFHATLGVNLFWHSTLGPLSLVLLLFTGSRPRWQWRHSDFNRLLVYVIGLSLAWMVLDYLFLHRYVATRPLNIGLGQTELKMPVQTARFVSQLLLFLVVPMRARVPTDAIAAIRGFLAGCSVSVVVGFFLITATTSGMVGRDEAGHLDIGQQSVMRMGGLSGEPKHLGAFLLVALCLLGALYFEQGLRLGRRLFASLAICVVGFFLTYSTSAWIGLAIALPVAFSLFYYWGSARSRTRAALLSATLAVGGVALLQLPFLNKAVEARVTARVLDEETARLNESKDNLVWDIYNDRPYWLPLGFGLGGTDLEAAPYFLSDPKYAAHLDYSRTPTPATNGVRLLGDLGLVGLFLFLVVATSVSRQANKQGYRALAVFSVAGFVGLMFVSLNAVSSYMFLLGAALALVRLRPTPGGSLAEQPISARKTAPVI